MPDRLVLLLLVVAVLAVAGCTTSAPTPTDTVTATTTAPTATVTATETPTVTTTSEPTTVPSGDNVPVVITSVADDRHTLRVAVANESTTRFNDTVTVGADTERDGDVFRCSCGYEGHADLDASRTFLERQGGTNLEVESMARPVRLTWDDHNWSELPHSPERASPNEERTNQSTRKGKLASVGTA